MKYLSLVVVIAFIAFTFWFTKKSEDMSLDQVNKINILIEQYMTQAVQNHQPNVQDIDFSKVYTEVIEPNHKMKAHFSFSYTEPNELGELEKVYRKGTFLITSEDGAKWTAKIDEAGDVKVEFLEPFEITEDGVHALKSADSTSEEEASDTSEEISEDGDASAEEETVIDEETEVEEE